MHIYDSKGKRTTCTSFSTSATCDANIRYMIMEGSINQAPPDNSPDSLSIAVKIHSLWDKMTIAEQENAAAQHMTLPA